MNHLPFELLFALRYLRPRRTFVSIITLISIIGVVLGVAVLIVVISVMTGFDLQLRDRIIGFESHLVVRSVGTPMQDYRSLASFIRQQPAIKGVSPFIEGPVVIETQQGEDYARIAAPYLRGVDPATSGEVSEIEQSVIAGHFETLHESGLLIGSELARRLALHVEDP
ncbi:MAG: ABC transporter permease, partial [Verrucomicrobiota bacterium]